MSKSGIAIIVLLAASPTLAMAAGDDGALGVIFCSSDSDCKCVERCAAAGRGSALHGKRVCVLCPKKSGHCNEDQACLPSPKQVQ